MKFVQMIGFRISKKNISIITGGNREGFWFSVKMIEEIHMMDTSRKMYVDLSGDLVNDFFNRNGK